MADSSHVTKGISETQKSYAKKNPNCFSCRGRSAWGVAWEGMVENVGLRACNDGGPAQKCRKMVDLLYKHLPFTCFFFGIVKRDFRLQSI